MFGEIREQCLNEVITHAVYLGFTRVFDAEKNYEEAYEYAKIFVPTIGNEIELFNEMYSEIFCGMFRENLVKVTMIFTNRDGSLTFGLKIFLIQDAQAKLPFISFYFVYISAAKLPPIYR